MFATKFNYELCAVGSTPTWAEDVAGAFKT